MASGRALSRVFCIVLSRVLRSVLSRVLSRALVVGIASNIK